MWVLTRSQVCELNGPHLNDYRGREKESRSRHAWRGRRCDPHLPLDLVFDAAAIRGGEESAKSMERIAKVVRDGAKKQQILYLPKAGKHL